MKKFFTLLLGVACIGAASAQTLVTTQITNKNAILEEYTGIHCQYCPQGHVIAQSILDNNPGRAASIAIHQGSYATPGSGEPDYRTPFGDALAGQTGLTGYPSGTVNRHIFPPATVTALGRGDWTSSSNTIMATVSPVNVGVTSHIDEATRALTVHVELYYTANSATSTNYINVALIQDSVIGPQTGGGAGNNYVHMHMLRYLVTDQWGDAVTTTTLGSLVERDYNYTIPAAYNSVPCIINHCQIVAFVTESHQEILSGDVVDAMDGTNLYVGDISAADSTMKLGHPANTTTFNLAANSNIAGSEQFKIKLTSNGPIDWSAGFTINGQTVTDSILVDLVKGTPTNLTVDVIPGSTSGFVTYTLALSSVNNPNAPTKYFKVYVLSNSNTLLVNAAGDDVAGSFAHVYSDGLTFSGSLMNAEMKSDIFVRAVQAGILSEIVDVFYNVSWTFPAFTDPEAAAVMSFIDNGGDFYLGGQDIGWDIMSGQDGSHGTTITHNLYTNYLKATWVDDGSTANNKCYSNTTDSIYGTVATGTVHDVFGGYMYPDQISPLDNATSIFYYDAGKTKISAIRSTKGSAKVVYFGFGLEMISEVAIANDIINRTWHWFMGFPVGIDETPGLTPLALNQNNPNPCSTETAISFNLPVKETISLTIYDVHGKEIRKMFNGEMPSGNQTVKVSTSSLNAGVYYYTLQTSAGQATRKMVVVK
ncbi:MAG: Omp28-related outer membrane protein [Bacteroidetes bacterium]|nr:Omp28-related outer membrane protein [Bacteroidota bacterium]